MILLKKGLDAGIIAAHSISIRKPSEQSGLCCEVEPIWLDGKQLIYFAVISISAIPMRNLFMSFSSDFSEEFELQQVIFEFMDFIEGISENYLILSISRWTVDFWFYEASPECYNNILEYSRNINKLLNSIAKKKYGRMQIANPLPSEFHEQNQLIRVGLY